MKATAIVSGGMDSVTLAYDLARGGELERIVSFDYGQRHRRELTYAHTCADRLCVPWERIDLRQLGGVLARSGSALVDHQATVPDGHYAEESMRQTVVPNRNMIMLAIAGGVAVAHGDDCIAIGAHTGDHFIYPDCRPEFLSACSAAMQLATEGFGSVFLYTPFETFSKANICQRGDALGVPWTSTWSCYKGGAIHCGACGTCFERREAFKLAGIDDPTDYETTPEYAAP